MARAGTLPDFLYQRPAEAGQAIPLEEGYSFRIEQEENVVIDTGDVRDDQDDEELRLIYTSEVSGDVRCLRSCVNQIKETEAET